MNARCFLPTSTLLLRGGRVRERAWQRVVDVAATTSTSTGTGTTVATTPAVVGASRNAWISSFPPPPASWSLSSQRRRGLLSSSSSSTSLSPCWFTTATTTTSSSSSSSSSSTSTSLASRNRRMSTYGQHLVRMSPFQSTSQMAASAYPIMSSSIMTTTWTRSITTITTNILLSGRTTLPLKTACSIFSSSSSSPSLLSSSSSLSSSLGSRRYKSTLKASKAAQRRFRVRGNGSLKRYVCVVIILIVAPPK